MTLIAEFFGGPSTGKSTTTALTYGLLKQEGFNAEMVHEFAKDLVWEKRNVALSNQIYVMGKQIHRFERLMGEVDIIVSDTSILLSSIYGDVSNDFEQGLLSKWHEWNVLPIFIERTEAHPFRQEGRNHSYEESLEKDKEIQEMLQRHADRYVSVPMMEGVKTAELAKNIIVDNLHSPV